MIKTSDWIYDIPEITRSQYFLEGAGQKRLLLITNKYPLPEDELLIVRKMFHAIGYNYDTDVFRLHLTSADHFDLSYLDIDYLHLISFGIDPIKLNIDIPFQKYIPVLFDSLWALFADDLTVFKNDSAKKQQLWNSLKSRFLTT